ncbi:hypothetical protein QVD17_39393 [Tagetes erecta]|uniref:Uncharacterized protein n=1 Tax=Tagetes erecta TaxID=13708 RepID=A0AAD8JQ62_TARER|nr:hypothetical protein QVD17_39393 [Tagetes erecta]
MERLARIDLQKGSSNENQRTQVAESSSLHDNVENCTVKSLETSKSKKNNAMIWFKSKEKTPVKFKPMVSTDKRDAAPTENPGKPVNKRPAEREALKSKPLVQPNDKPLVKDAAPTENPGKPVNKRACKKDIDRLKRKAEREALKSKPLVQPNDKPLVKNVS